MRGSAKIKLIAEATGIILPTMPNDDTQKNDQAARILQLERELSDLRRRLAAHEELIVRQERELHQITKALQALRDSLSFRIGWGLSAPARFLYNTLEKGFPGGRAEIALHFLKTGLSHPLRLIGQINRANLATLRKALKQESPKEISANLSRLLGDNGPLAPSPTPNAPPVRLDLGHLTPVAPSEIRMRHLNEKTAELQRLRIGASDSVWSRIVGQRTRRSGSPLLLVVGHQAGLQLGGAERSLLDLLDIFAEIGFDTVVAVPSLDNREYVEAIRTRSLTVYSAPVPLRHPNQEPDPLVIERFATIIAECGVSAVHTNTILPREPLLSARQAGIPAVVHAREIPDHDPCLCEWLEASAEQLVVSVLAEADYIIANSKATAETYPLAGRTSVVPNFVDVRRFDVERPTTEQVRVGLVSSTSYSKGQRGFVEVARLLESRVDASFVIIGPVPEPDGLLSRGRLPGNLRSVGYLEDPLDVMRQVDILLNLSTCDESFSRSTLEAMASSLPVVAFARGALVELVCHGQTGFLVPPDDLASLADRVEQLVRNPALRDTMGQAGRRVAEAHYSAEVAAAAMRTSYRAILPDPAVREHSASDLTVPFPSVNNSQFPHPFYVGNRARFAHCSGVKFIDRSRLVAVSLIGQRLYLVRFDTDNNTSEIVTTTHTTDGRQDVGVDLIDFDGTDRILAANCEHSSLSLYRLTGDRIELEDVISAGAPGERYCHGAKFVRGRPDLVCAAVTTGRPEVAFLSLNTRLQVDAFSDEGWVPKDVAFIDNRRMAVVFMRQVIDQDPRVTHHAKVALVDLHFTDDGNGHHLADELVLPGATADGCHVHGGTLFIADQAHDAVLQFDVSEGRFRRLADMVGFSFPHSMDVSPDGAFLAVANYGSNVVSIRRLIQDDRCSVGSGHG